MIRKSFEWRTENNVDSALKKPLDPFIKATFPYSLRGKDLQGRPVFEVCLGDWDIRKAIDEGKEEVNTFKTCDPNLYSFCINIRI